MRDIEKELERLKEQKKAIEEKIKILTGAPIYERCKIDYETYTTGKPTRHYLAIKYQPIDGRAKYQTIYSANDRKSVVDAIPAIVYELNELHKLASRAYVDDTEDGDSDETA